MTVHTLVRIDYTPHKPTTYRAQCGYLSHDRAEFSDPTTSRKPATCPECRDKVCRKCNQPRHTTAEGYRYQLCKDHLEENFAAIGMMEIPTWTR